MNSKKTTFRDCVGRPLDLIHDRFEWRNLSDSNKIYVTDSTLLEQGIDDDKIRAEQ